MRRPYSKGVNWDLPKCKGKTHLCTDKWERKNNKAFDESCSVLMHPYTGIYISRVLQHKIKHAV